MCQDAANSTRARRARVVAEVAADSALDWCKKNPVKTDKAVDDESHKPDAALPEQPALKTEGIRQRIRAGGFLEQSIPLEQADFPEKAKPAKGCGMFLLF